MQAYVNMTVVDDIPEYFDNGQDEMMNGDEEERGKVFKLNKRKKNLLS